jgi:hypothetical protein
MALAERVAAGHNAPVFPLTQLGLLRLLVIEPVVVDPPGGIRLVTFDQAQLLPSRRPLCSERRFARKHDYAALVPTQKAEMRILRLALLFLFALL